MIDKDVTKFFLFFILTCVYLFSFSFLFSASKFKNIQIIPVVYARDSRETSSVFSGSLELSLESNHLSGAELPFFSFSCMSAATNNFSQANKLGQGGFGPVYKVI